MIMVSFAFKLFVSSRPIKYEGVLCIYVFLFHEGQAENHLLWEFEYFQHKKKFIFLFNMISYTKVNLMIIPIQPYHIDS
jgi:hypothetical protein